MRRLVTLPVARETPADVLRLLRAVSCDAELVCVDGRRWQLLMVDPQKERSQIGRRMLARYRTYGATIDQWRQAHLMAQGASLMGEYTVEPCSALAADLAFMLDRSEGDLERDAEACLDGSEGLPRLRERIAVRSAFVQAEHKGLYAHAFRGRQSFLQTLTKPLASSVRRVLARA